MLVFCGIAALIAIRTKDAQSRSGVTQGSVLGPLQRRKELEVVFSNIAYENDTFIAQISEENRRLDH
jgi:hypothetical protein